VLLFYGELPGNTQRRLTTAAALLLMLLLARAAFVQTPAPHLAVGAYAFAIALLAITSMRPSTYAAGGVLALMVTLATRQGVSFLLILVSVAMVLYLGLRNVRHRGRIIGVGLLAGLTALAVTELVGFVSHQDLGFVFWNQAVWAALSTIAAAFIVEGILPAIERLCGVTTNMTLLEWCDPNKPLLRMLAAESPGTYNHSLLVGALADAAAEAIGASGLLARAGAYYHDIGKINKPEYFVENQAGGMQNMHERLSPAMSHLIIVGHVKDGIEMAKEYGLPVSLHPFIPEHHGTCVVEYFFSAATRARKPDDPEISDEQFRYPGPKPQSRETALVMLCDGVEGAVRAMPEPTPNRIEDTVARITHKRMLDGQFDECDLTFRELEIIRSTLVKSLCSLYHARISYPRLEPEPEPSQAS
jgi:putative nucleotidyltransferase with HDIG domain